MPCGGLFNPDKSKYPIFLPVLFPYTRRYPARRFESRSGYKTGTRQDCHSDPAYRFRDSRVQQRAVSRSRSGACRYFSAAIAIHLQIKQVHILEHCFLQNRYADALSILVCTEECRIRHFFQLIMLIRKAHSRRSSGGNSTSLLLHRPSLYSRIILPKIKKGSLGRLATAECVAVIIKKSIKPPIKKEQSAFHALPFKITY